MRYFSFPIILPLKFFGERVHTMPADITHVKNLVIVPLYFKASLVMIRKCDSAWSYKMRVPQCN